MNENKKRKLYIITIILLAIVAVGCIVMIVLSLIGKNRKYDSLETTTEPITTAEEITTEISTTETQTFETETTTIQTIEPATTSDGFADVSESVTAKELTNLRDKPSQGADSNIIATLKNGEVIIRIGINENGWSKVLYNETVCYAVSSYLTTDLSYVPETDDGIKTIFTECNDYVTAKEFVNLRTKPSVNNDIAPVAAVLYNGTNIQRTGVNNELGWSRVIYNGQTLYCITSYLNIISSEKTPTSIGGEYE